MGLDALGVWVLISAAAPGEIITVAETEQGCDYAHSEFTKALDPEYDPNATWTPYGSRVNPEIRKLAKCLFIPYEDLTPPEDL